MLSLQSPVCLGGICPDERFFMKNIPEPLKLTPALRFQCSEFAAKLLITACDQSFVLKKVKFLLSRVSNLRNWNQQRT